MPETRLRSRRTSRVRQRPGRPSDRQPALEAVSVILAVPPGRDPLAAARAVMRRRRLAGWRLDPVTEDGTEVELVPPARRVSPARAWDLTYALRAEPEVAHAEPMFRYFVPENARPDLPAGRRGRVHDPATASDCEWSLRKTGVLDAWRLFGGRQPGAGVLVGHPDTGYTPHPELADPARLLIGAGYDFDDDDPDPVDDLDAGFLDNPGHGTATGSVLVSGVGAAAGGTGPFVSGAAPHALLIPIRTTETVVLFSMRGLRRAIDHSTGQGAQVVSISLGGPLPGFGTRRAIQRAVDAGTIVLAAAGNEVGFVVFPAAFDEVIAVAASTIHDEPWSGSSRGPAVDISAPGESVWCARTTRDASGQHAFHVDRGTGTSYAVATTAGIAALWISFHGWPTLVRRYGTAGVARVFKQIMQATCRTPRGWNTADYGPGIVHATRLLQAPLPAAPPARKLRDASRPAVAADTTGIETLVHLLPGVPRARVEEAVADLLHIPDRQLPQLLQDFGDELVFQLVMHPALLEGLREGSRAGRVAASSRTAVRRRLTGPALSSRLRRYLERTTTPPRRTR